MAEVTTDRSQADSPEYSPSADDSGRLNTVSLLGSYANIALVWVLTALSVAASYFSLANSQLQAQAVALNAIFLVAAAVVGWLLVVLARGGQLAPVQRGTVLAGGAFLAWLTLSSLLSGRWHAAFFGEAVSMFGLAAIVVLLVCAWAAATHPEEVGSALSTIAPFVIVSQLAWAFTQNPGNDSGNGGYTNSSMLGMAMTVFLPWALAPAADKSRPAWERYARLAVAGFALVGLYLLGARMALVVAALTVGWFGLQLLSGGKAPSRSTKVRILVIVGVVLAVAGVALAFAEVAGQLSFPYLTSRYEMWDISLRSVASRPIMGFGADGFQSGGASVTSLNGSVRPYLFMNGTTDPHNLFIFTLVSSGYVGLLLLLATLAAFVRLQMGTRDGISRFDPAVVAVVGVLVILVITPVTLEVAPVVALSAGCAFALRSPAGPRSPSGRASTDIARRVAKVVALGVAAVVLVVYGADVAGRRALGPISQVQYAPLQVSLPLAERLGRLDPYFVYQATQSLGGLSEPEPTEGQVKRWRALRPEQLLTVDSLDPYYPWAYGVAIWRTGAPKPEVADALRESIERYPASPVSRAWYALLLVRMGATGDAVEYLESIEVYGDAQASPWGWPVMTAQEALATAP